MPFLKNQHNSLLVRWLWPCLIGITTLVFNAHLVYAQVVNTNIQTIRITRVDDGLHLNAQLSFDLPAVVEDALIKGVPVVFVAEAEVSRERWYWYDKKIATATKQMRLSFQPLSRRWRLSVSSGVIGSASLGGGLPQYFDTLTESLASIRRLTDWKIADHSDIEYDTPYIVDFRFKLDASQLPRPFQIGLIGNGDWTIAVTKTVKIPAEGSK